MKGKRQVLLSQGYEGKSMRAVIGLLEKVGLISCKESVSV